MAPILHREDIHDALHPHRTPLRPILPSIHTLTGSLPYIKTAASSPSSSQQSSSAHHALANMRYSHDQAQQRATQPRFKIPIAATFNTLRSISSPQPSTTNSQASTSNRSPSLQTEQNYSQKMTPPLRDHLWMSGRYHHYVNFVDRNPQLYPQLSWYGWGQLSLQPFRPPYLVPNHPIYIYYGRDLSISAFALPRLHDGRALFVRVVSGDQTDRGFGPGVSISDEFREEVGRLEQATTADIVAFDISRS